MRLCFLHRQSGLRTAPDLTPSLIVDLRPCMVMNYSGCGGSEVFFGVAQLCVGIRKLAQLACPGAIC